MGKPTMLRRSLLAAPALLAASAQAPLAAPAAPREVADATGRRIALPRPVTRVFPAGLPAAVLVCTVAPDLLAGWPSHAPRKEALDLLDPAAARPVLGRLAGPDDTLDLGALAAARAELVLEYGPAAPGFLARAGRIAAEAGIPALLLDGALGKIPETYLQLGDILDRPQAAAERAGIADMILLAARQAAARLQARGRPRVFLAHGPRGELTAPRGTLRSEALDFAGAENVATGPAEAHGLAPASPEQVRASDPDWILATDPAFLTHAQADPAWRVIRAVHQGRLVPVPDLPFGWLDAPAAVNRLLALVWLPVLFGVVPAETLAPRIEAFHATFYRRRPTAEQMRRLLAAALPPP
jgi:iron complex transport system substrate-binding protein